MKKIVLIAVMISSFSAFAQGRVQYPLDLVHCSNGSGPVFDDFKIVENSRDTYLFSYKRKNENRFSP